MKIGREIGQQDRRRQHGCAAKPLSAHRFARHGRAGEECRHTSQIPQDQRAFGCRLRPSALGHPRHLQRAEMVMGGPIPGVIPLY